MAGYFYGGSGGGADMQTLFLYSGGAAASSAPANMVLLGSPANARTSGSIVGVPVQPFVDSPWSTPASSVPRQGLSFSLSSRGSGKISGATTAMSAQEGYVLGSKFLKTAQQLLDEVVNMGMAIAVQDGAATADGKDEKKKADESEVSGAGEEKSVENATELTAAERQELQMKKAKLVDMLDEVEQRSRQYHQQMKAVASAFEAVAGVGSARAYTALSLRTISRQFRRIRDAIDGQVLATSRRLGEEESDSRSAVGARLRFIDSQLRQQQTLSQLKMTAAEHGVWRPQRGLPRRAVSVLRGWLFEHFLHPYPKDSEKMMLAKQTGLSRSQVSNWFINARVRLWKPMVEEMYMEEKKDRRDAAAADEDCEKELAEDSGSHRSISTARTEQDDAPKLKHVADYMPVAPRQPVPKHARTEGGSDEQFRSSVHEMSNGELLLQFMDGAARVGGSGYSLFTGGAATQAAGFGQADGYSYGIEQPFAPRYSAGGVSLTLGLQNCEDMPFQATHPPPFLGTASVVVGSPGGSGYSDDGAVNAFEVNMQDRKVFPSRLMRDFVV